jgi:hypothetical protein
MLRSLHPGPAFRDPHRPVQWQSSRTTQRPLQLGRATACCRARGASFSIFARLTESRSASRVDGLRRGFSSSSLLRDVAAAAPGFSFATHESPFKVSSLLHWMGQTRVLCFVSSPTSVWVTLILSGSIGWPPIVK